MKGGSGLVRLAWILLGLLAIGSVAFELGQPDTIVRPYASSFDPSGAAAFTELLRRDGYLVQIDTVIPPALPADRLAVAFIKWDEIGLPLETPADAATPPTHSRKLPGTPPDSSPDDPFDSTPDTAPAVVRLMVEHMRKGGMAMILGYNPKSELKVDGTESNTIVDLSGHSYSIVRPPSRTSPTELSEPDASVAGWTSDGQPFANLDQVGKGRAIVLGTGEVAMNYFIDQGDNARLLLDQLHLLAPKGSKLDVIDGSVSGAGGGLIDVLGPWAHGVQLQVILVGVVIVYSLGKRFGLADESPRAQRSARDLLEGIADTYGRGRAAKAGLAAVLQDADRAVRRQLKLPADAPIRKRNEMLPAGASQALTACEHALMQDPSSKEALSLARNLETELELFLRHRRPAAKPIRRRVNSP